MLPERRRPLGVGFRNPSAVAEEASLLCSQERDCEHYYYHEPDQALLRQCHAFFRQAFNSTSLRWQGTVVCNTSRTSNGIKILYTQTTRAAQKVNPARPSGDTGAGVRLPHQFWFGAADSDACIFIRFWFGRKKTRIHYQSHNMDEFLLLWRRIDWFLCT